MEQLALRGDRGNRVSQASRARIREALDDLLAPSTRRAYLRHWAKFESYCAVAGYQSLPADVDVVCEYLQVLEHSAPEGKPGTTYSVGYIDQVASAIKSVHKTERAVPIAVAGEKPIPALWSDPQLSAFMRAMRNRAARQGRSDPKQEEPLLLDELVACISTARAGADTWRKRLHERRDTAVLLLGWASAGRRSEVTGLRVRDVKMTYSKWTITVRFSKTDQEGKSQVKALPVGGNLVTCGPCAVVRWTEAVAVYDQQGRAGLIRLLSGDDTPTRHVCAHPPTPPKPLSPLFRRITRSGDIDPRVMSDEMVTTILRRRLSAADLGVDVDQYGAHSLRAGFVTESLLQDKEHHQIMRQSGHRTMKGLLKYARERSVFDNNAVTDLGL